MPSVGSPHSGTCYLSNRFRRTDITACHPGFGLSRDLEIFPARNARNVPLRESISLKHREVITTDLAALQSNQQEGLSRFEN